MKARVLKDTTIEVKAGQIVDIDEKQFALASALGMVEKVEEKKTKKK